MRICPDLRNFAQKVPGGGSCSSKHSTVPVTRIPDIPAPGISEAKRQRDSEMESNPEPTRYEKFLIYPHEVLVYILFTRGWCVQPSPMFRQRTCPTDSFFFFFFYLMSTTQENVPAPGLSISPELDAR